MQYFFNQAYRLKDNDYVGFVSFKRIAVQWTKLKIDYGSYNYVNQKTNG